MFINVCDLLIRKINFPHLLLFCWILSLFIFLMDFPQEREEIMSIFYRIIYDKNVNNFNINFIINEREESINIKNMLWCNVIN